MAGAITGILVVTMMEDKEILRLISEMEDRHRIELRDVSCKIDKVLENQALQSERIRTNENGIKNSTEKLNDFKAEFSRTWTNHDNFHSKAIRRWYRVVIAMCAVTTAVVGLMAFILKMKG